MCPCDTSTAPSWACSLRVRPLERHPASMAMWPPLLPCKRKPLVRCFGVSPPWQPTTLSSISRPLPELLGHLEELEEVFEPIEIVHDDGTGVFDGDHLHALQTIE